MKKSKLILLGLLGSAMLSLTSCIFFDLSDDEDNLDLEKMELVWSDEFDYKGVPDTKKWKYETGTNGGWGNNELQKYVSNKNKSTTASVDGEALKIKAFYDADEGIWKSARMNSKESWKYGYIEAKLKVTNKKGAWPAFWMMPKDSKYGNWPASGEIDIMENAPSTCGANRVFSTLHAQGHFADKGKGIGSQTFDETFGDEWHTFGIHWEESKITCYYDGYKQETYYNDGTGYENWPYDEEFFIILNLAIGGNLGGTGDAASLKETGAEFLVDYVRVYQ